MPVGSADLMAAIIEFERVLVAFGLALPAGGVVVDGDIHRVDDVQHHRKRNYAGWYVLARLPSGLVMGWYGSWWLDRGKQSWSSRQHKTFTKADRAAIADQSAKFDADCLLRYGEGAERAVQMLATAKLCSLHPYLEHKQVRSYGLRVLGDNAARSFDLPEFVGDLLLIPVNDLDGNLCGLQWIDADGKKRYTSGTNRSSGTCFLIGTLHDAVVAVIVEGYATGATIHEAIGLPVVVAFDAGGVEKIAMKLRQRLPTATLIFAGDNDPEEKGYRGQKAAYKAARVAGGVVALPPGEGDDWNDHAAKHGLDDVRARLTAAAGVVELPPTVTLIEGQVQIEQIVNEFFDQATAWHELPDEQRNDAAPPQWSVNGTMGSGKSRIARLAAGRFLMKKLGSAIVTSAPLHRLANEQARLFANETLHQPLIWRGMDQPDPDRGDGSNMCLEPELSKAAQKAGLNVSSICKLCPSRKHCGYRRQQKLSGRVWYVPHQLLFHPKPKPIPAPSVLVVDEAFHASGLAENVRLALSTLEGEVIGVPHRDDRALLVEARSALLSAFRRAEAEAQASGAKRSRLTKTMVEAAGLDADTVREARRIEWSRKPDAPLESGVPDMVQELQAIGHRFTPKVPRLWSLIEDLLCSEHETSIGIEIEPNARLQDGSRGTMLWLHYRLDIHPSWRGPTLLLDGTAKPELVRLFFPALHVAAEIHIGAPHQRVTWICNSFAKARFVPTEGALDRANKARQNNVEDLRRYIEAKAAQYRGRGGGQYDALVVTNLDIETLLQAGQGLPANVAIEHFNNLRGTDIYGGVRAVIVIGRPLPSSQTIHRQAERLAGRPLDQTDPLVAAVRWSICEAELLQVIARARGIRRTANNPLDVFLLGDTPLPLKIDCTMSWGEAQPHPLELLAARGVVPACDTDAKGYWAVVAAVLPDLFGTPNAARTAFTRSREQTSMNNISIDIRSREGWQSFKARPLGSRYAIPVRVDRSRRSDLEAILDLVELEKPTSRAAVLSREQMSIGTLVPDAWQPQNTELQVPSAPISMPAFEAAFDPAPFPGDRQACPAAATAPPERFEGDDSPTACCVPFALPEALGSVGEAIDYLVEAQPGPMPVSLEGNPGPDPLMNETLIWLSDQIRFRDIQTFESLEPVDPTLGVEETLHKRMQAEWRDRQVWHRARHNLAVSP
jgi:putative DNA primase/helicase